jgi:hypothetical protein
MFQKPSTVIIFDDPGRLGVTVHPGMAKTGLLGGTIAAGHSCEFVTEMRNLVGSIDSRVPQLLVMSERGDRETATLVAVELRHRSSRLRVAIVCPHAQLRGTVQGAFDYRLSTESDAPPWQSPEAVLRRFFEDAGFLPRPDLT